jgi:hypothetical protein
MMELSELLDTFEAAVLDIAEDFFIEKTLLGSQNLSNYLILNKTKTLSMGNEKS